MQARHDAAMYPYREKNANEMISNSHHSKNDGSREKKGIPARMMWLTTLSHSELLRHGSGEIRPGRAQKRGVLNQRVSYSVPRVMRQLGAF